MGTNPYYINQLIDTAKSRLESKVPDIGIQAERLKKAAAKPLDNRGLTVSELAPIYEAVVNDPALAGDLHVTVSAYKNDSELEAGLREAGERPSHFKSGPAMAVHFGTKNRSYIIEFADENNLIKEVTAIHMARVAGDKRRS